MSFDTIYVTLALRTCVLRGNAASVQPYGVDMVILIFRPQTLLSGTRHAPGIIKYDSAPKLPSIRVYSHLRGYGSRCMAYPFSGPLFRAMSHVAAAADLGCDSWRRPALAGALPACRISHTEGPCLCEMQGQGAGSEAVK